MTLNDICQACVLISVVLIHWFAAYWQQLLRLFLLHINSFSFFLIKEYLESKV